MRTSVRLTEMFNICDYCVYAPCLCGDDPENCVSYIQRNGVAINKEAK